MSDWSDPPSARQEADRILEDARATIARFSIHFDDTLSAVAAARNALEETARWTSQDPLDRARWTAGAVDLGRTLGCELLSKLLAVLRDMRPTEPEHDRELQYKARAALRSQDSQYPPVWLEAAKRRERQPGGAGPAS